MFRSTNNFDKLLDKATSHLLMEPDWPSIIQLCDLIRQNDVQPKYALNAVKKKLFSQNQHTALYALLVLESMVKNCGYPLHEELTTRAFCDTLYELAKTTPHENVRQKLFELIQAWNFAFRKSPKHGALKNTMALMKSDGFKFPAFRESDAMFSADSAPEWADGDVCHRCRIAFGILQRKHHCHACGQVFCAQCTQKTTTLPKYGIERAVRVCDACYDQATKPSAASKAAAEKQETELPPEYLNSSRAQQSQAPPRKSDVELREEEELQLAIAISQSEAEAKEKEKKKFKMVNTFKVPVPDRSPSPVKEQSNPEIKSPTAPPTIHERVAFEYFKSSVAQQTQVLRSTSDDELREKEEANERFSVHTEKRTSLNTLNVGELPDNHIERIEKTRSGEIKWDDKNELYEIVSDEKSSTSMKNEATTPSTNKIKKGDNALGKFIISKLNEITDEAIRVDVEQKIIQLLYDGIIKCQKNV